MGSARIRAAVLPTAVALLVAAAGAVRISAIVAAVLGAAAWLLVLSRWDRHRTALPLLTLSLVVVAIPMGPASQLLRIGPATGIGAVALAAAVLAGVAAGMVPWGGLRLRPAPLLAAMAFVSWTAIATLAAPDPRFTWLAFPVLWAASFVLGLTVHGPSRGVVLSGWLLLAALTAAYALREFAVDSAVLWGDVLSVPRSYVVVGGKLFVRAQAAFGHPVPAGLFMAAIGVAGCGLILRGRRLRLALATTPLILAGVVVTFSRSAWLGAAFGLVAVAGTIRPGWRPSTGGLVAVIVAAATVTVLWGAPFFGHLDAPRTTLSFTQRQASLDSLPALLQRPPGEVLAGSGLASATDLYDTGALTSAGLRVVDNQYVTLLIETGAVGIFLLGALLLLVLSKVRDDPAQPLRSLRAALVVLVVGLAFFEGLYWPPVAVLFWSCVGMLSGGVSQRSPRVLPAPTHAVAATAASQVGRVGVPVA